MDPVKWGRAEGRRKEEGEGVHCVKAAGGRGWTPLRSYVT